MSPRALWTVLTAALLATASAEARGPNHRPDASTFGGRAGISRCDQWHVEFDGEDAAVAEESATIPSSQASPLVARAAGNGGTTVVGTDGSEFRITLCKAVPKDDAAALSKIAISRDGSRVSVDGPSDGDWTAHLIVRAPKGSAVEVESENGPVDVSDFDGSAKVASDNGPVGLRRTSGRIEVHATNGPIAFEGGSGSVLLDSDNGPLTVRLRDGEWRGGSFEGRTHNGPLHVSISEGFGSGVLVETDGNSPFRCGAEACRNARRNWDDRGKSIAFGPEKAVVVLATRNGPVSISD